MTSTADALAAVDAVLWAALREIAPVPRCDTVRRGADILADAEADGGLSKGSSEILRALGAVWSRQVRELADLGVKP